MKLGYLGGVAVFQGTLESGMNFGLLSVALCALGCWGNAVGKGLEGTEWAAVGDKARMGWT